MNELIESICTGFAVDGVSIPVEYMYYEGHYYDFDIYASGNYIKIIEALKALLKAHGFIWQPSRSSQDMYETDTGYYHKTLNFAYLKEE